MPTIDPPAKSAFPGLKAQAIHGLSNLATIEIQRLFRAGDPNAGEIVAVIKDAINRAIELSDDGLEPPVIILTCDPKEPGLDELIIRANGWVNKASVVRVLEAAAKMEEYIILDHGR